MTTKYVPCDESEIPEGITFSAPAYRKGQIVERTYGDFTRDEHDDGDPYMCVVDHSDEHPVPKYYRRAKRS